MFLKPSSLHVKPQKAVRHEHPITAARRAKKSLDRAKKQVEAGDVLRARIKERNDAARERTKEIDLESLEYENSTLRLPREVLVPEWPYPKGAEESTDIELSLITAPAASVSSSAVPARFLQRFKNITKEPSEYNAEKWFKVPVIRMHALAPNGVPTVVYAYGDFPKMRVRLPRNVARCINMKAFGVTNHVVSLDDTSWRDRVAASDTSRIADTVVTEAPGQGKKQKIFLPEADFIATKNRKAERDARDAHLATQPDANNLCKHAMVELERRLVQVESLARDSGDFNQALIINAQLKLGQNLYEYDFDEQFLTIEFTFSNSRVPQAALDSLLSEGLELMSNRFKFLACDIFNFRPNAEIDFLNKTNLSGQSWFTLPHGKYEATYGQIPWEGRSDFQRRTYDSNVPNVETSPMTATATPTAPMSCPKEDENVQAASTFIHAGAKRKPHDPIQDVDCEDADEDPISSEQPDAKRGRTDDTGAAADKATFSGLGSGENENDGQCRPLDADDGSSSILVNVMSGVQQIDGATTTQLPHVQASDNSTEWKSHSHSWYRAEFHIHYSDIVSHRKSSEHKYDKVAPFRTAVIDLEVEPDPKVNKIPLPGNPDPRNYDKGKPILSAAIDFEYKPGCFSQHVFSWKSKRQKWEGKIDLGPVFYHEFVGEREMMQGISDWIRNCQPTLLAGHNVVFFDCPFLLDRAHFLGLSNFGLLTPLMELSRMEEKLFESRQRGQQLIRSPRIPGVIIIDTLLWARNEEKFKHNDLNNVGVEVVGETKHEVHFSRIPFLFHDGSQEDKKSLLEYNVQDCVLVRKIMIKKDLIGQQSESCRQSGITMEMYNTRGESLKTDTALRFRCTEFGFMIPHDKSTGKSEEDIAMEKAELEQNKNWFEDANGVKKIKSLKQMEAASKARKVKYIGAGCLDVDGSPAQPAIAAVPAAPGRAAIEARPAVPERPPTRGFYTDPVSVADFASLYPSILDAHNLCYSTKVSGENKNRLDELGPTDYQIVRCERVDDKGKVVKVVEHVYVERHVRRGQMSLLVKDYVDARNIIKELLATEQDPERLKLLTKRSKALKLLANAAYGYCAADSMPCMAISETVCRIGRTALEDARYDIETWFNPDNPEYLEWLQINFPDRLPDAPIPRARVLYGDTDSVMVLFGVKTLAESNIFGAKAVELCNLRYKHRSPMRLDQEKEYQPFGLMEKKTYVALLYKIGKNQTKYVRNDTTGKYESEIPGGYVPTLDTKGAENQRRDKNGFVQRTLERQWEIAVWENDISKLVQYASEQVSALLQGHVDPSELIESQSTKLSYDTVTPAAAVAEKLKQRGTPVLVGERVYYIRTLQPTKKSMARKRFSFDEKTSMQAIINEWENAAEKASICVDDAAYVIENNIPIDYEGILIAKVVGAFYRAHRCLLNEAQMKQVWEPLTSRQIRADHDIKREGAIDSFTVAARRCQVCHVPLQQPSTLEAGVPMADDDQPLVVVHPRKFTTTTAQGGSAVQTTSRMLCTQHMNMVPVLKDEFETKLHDATNKHTALVAKCTACVGPRGVVNACSVKSCKSYYPRIHTGKMVASQKLKLADLLDW
jgi:DNA polymerase elongation subunit (family B)